MTRPDWLAPGHRVVPPNRNEFGRRLVGLAGLALFQQLADAEDDLHERRKRRHAAASPRRRRAEGRNKNGEQIPVEGGSFNGLAGVGKGGCRACLGAIEVPLQVKKF